MKGPPIEVQIVEMWEPLLNLHDEEAFNGTITDDFGNRYEFFVKVGYEWQTEKYVAQLWVPASEDKRFATARYDTREEAMASLSDVSHVWAGSHGVKYGKLPWA